MLFITAEKAKAKGRIVEEGYRLYAWLRTDDGVERNFSHTRWGGGKWRGGRVGWRGGGGRQRRDSRDVFADSERGKGLPESGGPRFISVKGSDDTRPCHGLVPTCALGGVLLSRLQFSHLRPQHRVIGFSCDALMFAAVVLLSSARIRKSLLGGLGGVLMVNEMQSEPALSWDGDAFLFLFPRVVGLMKADELW